MKKVFDMGICIACHFERCKTEQDLAIAIHWAKTTSWLREMHGKTAEEIEDMGYAWEESWMRNYYEPWDK